MKETEDKLKKTHEENSNLLYVYSVRGLLFLYNTSFVFRDKVKGSKDEINKLSSHINALKEQLLYAKVKMREAEKVEEELKLMKTKVLQMEHLQKGIQGSYEDAQDVARTCENVSTLSQIMLSLKKFVFYFFSVFF